MSILFWDIETRSSVNLEVAGAWRYSADSTTEVMVVGFAVDDGDPQIWVPGRQAIPEPFITAAADPSWLIVAHHHQFERALAARILTPRFGWPEVPLERQVCTMTMALASALPGGLDAAAAALGIPLQKDREGHKVMRRMSRPLPRRKRDPEDCVRWYEPTASELKIFHGYCKRDVALERMVFRALPLLPSSEQALFVLDAVINERGFHVDVDLAKAARAIANAERIAINAKIATLTGNEITSVDQVARIVAFVRRHGHLISSLGKRSVSDVLAQEPGGTVQRLLELRREGARASVRKLDSLLASVDDDGRLRGTLKFYGSSTGRWSGRGYQPQNLKKVETTDIDAAVDAILAGDIDRIRELGAPLTIAGDVSRSIVCAPAQHVLIGSDFSAIESRVLAWLAGETWKLDTYRQYDKTGDPVLEPYCVGASKVLKRAVTPDDKAGRDLGKVFDLAFGFGGGLGAWRKFDPSDTYSDAEVENFKREWRWAHRATAEFWKDLRRAALQAVHTGQRTECGKLSFAMQNGTLLMTLPSGRSIAYPKARIGPGKLEGTREIYFKDNAKGAWTDCSTWYGLLVENAVQAVARDLLAAALVRLENANFRPVLHIHDEVICEVPEGSGNTEDFLRLLTVLPDWAEGLPVAARAWSGLRYAAKTAPTKAAPKTMNGVKPHTIPVASTIALLEDDDSDGADTTVLLADVIGEPLVNGRICCPFHDDHTPSLVVYPDHFHCYVCGAHGDHIDWLMMVEGMDRKQAEHFLAAWDGPPVEVTSDNGEARTTFALQLWAEGRPIADTLAARYLDEIRGIDLAALPADVDQALRFHPRCPFGPGLRHACLLALMRDVATDTPTGIHRIALTADAQKIDRRTLAATSLPHRRVA